MSSYDDWKQDADAAPDPGRGGEYRRYTVACVDCAWRYTGHGMLAANEAGTAADSHHKLTGHAVGVGGVIQACWQRTDHATQAGLAAGRRRA